MGEGTELCAPKAAMGEASGVPGIGKGGLRPEHELVWGSLSEWAKESRPSVSPSSRLRHMPPSAPQARPPSPVPCLDDCFGLSASLPPSKQSSLCPAQPRGPSEAPEDCAFPVPTSLQWFPAVGRMPAERCCPTAASGCGFIWKLDLCRCN